MTNLQTDEQEIMQVENAYWIEMKEALDKLHDNPEFKKVILEGYFKDKAVNGVSLLALDSIKQGGHRTDVMEDLIAISSLQDYFATIQNLGTIPDDEEYEDNVEV